MHPSYKSLLSRPRILDFYRANSIRIDPFNPDNLRTVQYAVTLGKHCFRMESPGKRDCPVVFGSPIYNPFDGEERAAIWVRGDATPHRVVMEKSRWGSPLKGIGLDEKIIMLRPGERIAAHTEEFIGSSSRNIATMLLSCSDGPITVQSKKIGELEYCGRWSLMITNTSLEYAFPLVAGRRIAEVVFFETTPDHEESVGMDFETMKAKWRPEDILV